MFFIVDQDFCYIFFGSLEYRLLLIFANNQGVLLSRQQILDKIWDIDGNFVEDNTLTVYVKRLREKLGEAINIETGCLHRSGITFLIIWQIYPISSKRPLLP